MAGHDESSQRMARYRYKTSAARGRQPASLLATSVTAPPYPSPFAPQPPIPVLPFSLPPLPIITVKPTPRVLSSIYVRSKVPSCRDVQTMVENERKILITTTTTTTTSTINNDGAIHYYYCTRIRSAADTVFCYFVFSSLYRLPNSGCVLSRTSSFCKQRAARRSRDTGHSEDINCRFTSSRVYNIDTIVVDLMNYVLNIKCIVIINYLAFENVITDNPLD